MLYRDTSLCKSFFFLFFFFDSFLLVLLSHIFTNSHIANRSFPHTPAHLYTLTQGPMGSGVCTNAPSSLLSLSRSLSRLVFRHAGSSTLGCTRSPPALPLPPSFLLSLYISPVRHLHGNAERDLCPWRAV